MSEAKSPRWISTKDFIDSTISHIQEQYVQAHPTSTSKAILAQLRRGVGKEIGEIPELLAFTINPQTPKPRGDDPTNDERACYAAITLYSMHQQSASKRMHVKGKSFGTALGTLRYRDGEENQGVIRRFQAMATSLEAEELVYHARGLISLLRKDEIGFDYGQFGRDLAKLWNPESADAVRLAWGRDFYRVFPPAEEKASSPSH